MVLAGPYRWVRHPIYLGYLVVMLGMFMVSWTPRMALVVAGGVASNASVRSAFVRFAGESGIRLVLPPPILCTDNGAMIAWAGIERLQLGLVDDLTAPPRPRWPLDPEAERAPGGRA